MLTKKKTKKIISIFKLIKKPETKWTIVEKRMIYDYLIKYK